MQGTRYSLILPFCISLVIAASVHAQAPDPLVIPQSYDIEMILPEALSRLDYLHDPIQDSMGYVWFSSVDGLHCYDGMSLITYEISADTLQTGYFTLQLCGGYTLYAILNQAHEVAVFDVRARKVIDRIPLPTEEGWSHLLSTDGQGDVYLLSSADLLPTTILCLSDSRHLPVNLNYKGAITYYEVYDGNHWVRTDSAFLCFDANGALIDSLKLSDIPDRIFMAGRFDHSLLFYSHTEAAIYRWDSSSKALELLYRVPSGFKRKAFDFYLHDDDIWLERTPRGLFIWNPTKGTIQDYTQSMIDITRAQAPLTLANELSNFLPLRNGHMLLFYGNSIFRMSPHTSAGDVAWEDISSGKNLTSMRGLAEDEKGNIYASYYTGVSVKKPGSDHFKEFRDTRRAKKFKENTYSLTCVDDKLIWNNIVFDLGTGAQKSIERDGYGLHMNHCLMGDTLWTYTWYANKLSVYDIKREIAYTYPGKVFPGEQSASRMVADPFQGRILMATSSLGICALNRVGKVVYQYPTSKLRLPAGRTNVYDILPEEDEIWFGCEFGLGNIDRATEIVTYYNVPISNASGEITNRFVYNIIENETGDFYLATNQGLLKFDKASRTFMTLPEGHILNQLEYNRNSVLKASDGRYYLGTINGLVSFYPKNLPFHYNQNTAARPLLTSISILNGKNKKKREIRSDLFNLKTMELKSSDSNISFLYASPREDDDILYCHRILPLDSTWSNFNTNGRTDILSLMPGNYKLEIMATTVPVSKSGSITRINITIPRVWYKQWWAITLFFLIPLLFAIAFMRWQYRQKLTRQLAMENLRIKISSDLHDDVGSILSGLAMQSEMMSYTTKDDSEKSSLKQISTMSREAMDRMRDTVWAIDSRKDKYGNLIDRMRAHAENVLQRKEIEYAFESGTIDPHEFINPAVRQNIYLIFKEAITNIVRHSDATHVQITFRNNGQATELIVYDNGTNAHKTNSDGLGISNMKMRAGAVNGSIIIGFEMGYNVRLIVPNG